MEISGRLVAAMVNGFMFLMIWSGLHWVFSRWKKPRKWGYWDSMGSMLLAGIVWLAVITLLVMVIG